MFYELDRDGFAVRAYGTPQPGKPHLVSIEDPCPGCDYKWNNGAWVVDPVRKQALDDLQAKADARTAALERIKTAPAGGVSAVDIAVALGFRDPE